MALTAFQPNKLLHTLIKIKRIKCSDHIHTLFQLKKIKTYNEINISYIFITNAYTVFTRLFTANDATFDLGNKQG